MFIFMLFLYCFIDMMQSIVLECYILFLKEIYESYYVYSFNYQLDGYRRHEHFGTPQGPTAA